MSAIETATTRTVEARPGQYLSFMLGGEVFALAILGVKEIIEYGEMTTVPMMPGFIRGVINLRGRVVPVIDLSARFGRDVTKIGRRTCFVIVETAGDDGETVDIGIMVDAVNEVIDIAAGDIEPAPGFGAGIRADYISGMAKRGDRFVILLAMQRVLSVQEMTQLGHAAGAHEGSGNEGFPHARAA